MSADSRRPRPASSSQPIPRADRLAVTLALGTLGLAAGAAGCHREPLCMNPGAIDGDPAHTAWWSRLTRLISCETPGGTTAVNSHTGTNTAVPVPGAMPIAQPTPPDPVQAPGEMAVVTPQPVTVQGGLRPVQPHPPTPPEPTNAPRTPTTRVRGHHSPR